MAAMLCTAACRNFYLSTKRSFLRLLHHTIFNLQEIVMAVVSFRNALNILMTTRRTTC
uniref:Uncharacterized protein n=1 Tax=Arundo donax TaxID=35708 RepID=A0A0A9BWW1_ARUDO